MTYSISAQPVVSFVAGLEFDLLPAPLMEITTEVCWPDRVTAPDLSLIATRSHGKQMETPRFEMPSSRLTAILYVIFCYVR